MNKAGLTRAAYLVAAATPFGAVASVMAIASEVSGPANPSGGSGAVVPVFMVACAAIPALALVALFVWLARRPRWWGKLVCLVGVPWVMFSVMAAVVPHLVKGGETLYPLFANPLMYAPGVSGAVLLAVGVTLLVLDPRFSDAPRSSVTGP